MAKRKTPISEELVIYWSQADQCYIAHSIHTDQVGTGHRIVDALAEVIKAINAVCAEAAQDRTLAILREAPPEIQEMREKAEKLPGEIFEVAHKIATGDWPKDWVPEPRRQAEAFTTQMPAVPC